MTRGRRPLLAIALVSIVVNAALGVYALLAPDFGDTEGNVLGTSISVTGAAVLVLACLPALERGLVRPAALAGMGSSMLGFALVVGTLWVDAAGGDVYQRVMWTIFTVAGTGVLVSLLALVRLAPAHRWTLPAATGLTMAVVAMTVSLVWGEWEADWFFRALGIVSVLLAALAVATPVLHRLDRAALAPSASSGPELRYCPACGSALAGKSAEGRACPACSARFVVRFRQS